jgi:hypothetical protein
MSSESETDALGAGDRVFHEAYSGARDGVRDQVPILVVLPNQLSLHQHNQREVAGYSRPSFASAKSAAHIAVALFALTCSEAKAEQARVGIARLLQQLSAALGAAQHLHTELSAEINALLQCCLIFARAAHEGRLSESAPSEFASDAGQRILRVTELATREQIAGLHEAVEAIFSKLSARAQAELQVVVVGDHQARTRSLGMQYFKRRFREGEAMDLRVTYGENIDDEQEAIALVATRRLDQRIALAFFGDEHRLQRDVLGDAAKRCLDQLLFSPESEASRA